MKKEYGILKIEKTDSETAKKIKDCNNLIMKDMSESHGYSGACGFFAGLAAVFGFGTLAAFRYDTYLGVKVGGIALTGLTTLMAIAFASASNLYRHRNQDKVNDLSLRLIEEQREKEMMLTAKKTVNRINK